jgi:hypothetical protein
MDWIFSSCKFCSHLKSSSRYLIFAIFSFFFIVFNSTLFAQISLSFEPLYDSSRIQFTNELPADSNQISIETLRFYISDITFFQNDSQVFHVVNSSHLVDLSAGQAQTLDLDITQKLEFNVLKFNLGIDSLTNVSGALSGDLDPTQGMYWSWQSGYINFKLEGKALTCTTRNKLFQYHLGGYMHPYNALRTIELPVQASEPISISLDLNKILSLIKPSQTPEVMSPGISAMMISNIVAASFK